MKFNLDKVYEKSNKLKEGVWLILIFLAYVYKNIYYFSIYIAQFPKLVEEMTGEAIPMSKGAMIIGLLLSSVLMAMIVKIVVKFLYNTLFQRRMINNDINGFASAFYMAYVFASIIVGSVNIFGFLAPEMQVVGTSVVEFIAHSVFYFAAYVYVNKKMINPLQQTASLKILSTLYLAYYYAMSISNIVRNYEVVLNLILSIAMLLLTGGLHFIVVKLKVKVAEQELKAREEETKNPPKAEEPKAPIEVFKGFGF